MQFIKRLLIFPIFILAMSEAGFAQSGGKLPRVFVIDPSALLDQKEHRTSPTQKGAIEKIDHDAQRALTTEILSIVTKQAAPPSGDKHDYMSQAPYFWRNPKTADGFPYIRRDGERNPEIKKYPDHDLLDKMISAVQEVSVGYYFTGREEYAKRAAAILRLWFIDPKTKMNPNLEFAQAIPGLNTGRGIGIIETRGLVKIVDAVGLLDGSPSWTKADQASVEDWFARYLKWLRESKNGRDEAEAKNNHGTFYDVQAVSFALFTGQNDLAKSILESAKQKRIARQIEPDGRQPLELERTKSWSYSVMNLDGLVMLAELGDNVGVDLWSYRAADGRGIRSAIEFLDQFADGSKKWAYVQIEPFSPAGLYSIMHRAEGKYTDEKYRKMMSAIPHTSGGKPGGKEL